MVPFLAIVLFGCQQIPLAERQGAPAAGDEATAEAVARRGRGGAKPPERSPAPTPPPWGPSDPSRLRPTGPLTVTTPGAVVENVDVAGPIHVRASNVTIRNFRASNVAQESGITGLVLESGEIHGNDDPAFALDGVTWANYTARRLDVHHVVDGFKAHGNVLIEQSWVHDLNVLPAGGAGGPRPTPSR
ncbi:MAG: hypothetical protein M5U14_00845 [Acidimicrobiia bacterium]|nr:hypothetical protein [Acidimicrobiia bacterium]